MNIFNFFCTKKSSKVDPAELAREKYKAHKESKKQLAIRRARHLIDFEYIEKELNSAIDANTGAVRIQLPLELQQFRYELGKKDYVDSHEIIRLVRDKIKGSYYMDFDYNDCKFKIDWSCDSGSYPPW